jgi:hypothetical protein
MKQKDIILIIFAVFVSGVLSFILSNKLFAVPQDQQAEVEVVEPITAEFTQPDPRYFNDKSINPTQPIQIGDGNNTKPFSDDQN